MGQITRTTNPTGLKAIEKRLFVVRVRDDSVQGRFFRVESFDFSEAQLEPLVDLSCIAHAGNTEEYFELGSVSNFNTGELSLRSLASDQPLKFRFLFSRPGDPLLIGYTDGVQALDESGMLGSSLVDIEPADLGGATWKLVLPEGTGAGDKPNVLVERSLFPTSTAAARHPWFGVLVMPEVMRQIAIRIAENPSALEDSETWISKWEPFIAGLGIQPPMDVDEDDATAMDAWASEVVSKFTGKNLFRQHLLKAQTEMEGQQP